MKTNKPFEKSKTLFTHPLKRSLSLPILAALFMATQANAQWTEESYSNYQSAVYEGSPSVFAELKSNTDNQTGLRLYTSTYSWILGVQGSEDGKFKIAGSHDLRGSTYLTIDIDGNTGIGTANPSEKLDVAGNANINGRLSIGSAEGLVLANTEANYFTGTEQNGLLTFDLNYHGSNEYAPGYFINKNGSGGGGGLAVYSTEDDWSAILDTKNMAYLEADFNSLKIDGVERINNVGQFIGDGSQLTGITNTSSWVDDGSSVSYTEGNVSIGDTLNFIEGNRNNKIISVTSSLARASYFDFLLTNGFDNNSVGNSIMRIKGNGLVGIGTTNPSERLEVAGNVKATAFIGDGSQLTGITGASVWADDLDNSISYSDGDVTITNGGLVAQKIAAAVDTSSFSWPDYVFATNYQLPSLASVEDFIKKEKHLPEVPSESEVMKEGIDLGKMDATLLKKVEELTLYIIEQNKRIERLEAQNN